MDVRAESTMLATVLCASSEMVMAAFGGASVTVILDPGEMIMKALHLVLLLLAFLCFCLCIYYDDWKPAARSSIDFRPNLLALGLAFWVSADLSDAFF